MLALTERTFQSGHNFNFISTKILYWILNIIAMKRIFSGMIHKQKQKIY